MPNSLFSKQLLAWYDPSHRPLPWRQNPDPYAIWVSEIMLQQTRMETVLPYYERFMKRFPDVQSLAAAEEEELLKLWEGLGYYRRARHLQEAARILTKEYQSSLPQSALQLRELPGIGEYTAAAIASTAFGEPIVLQDGNVQRVLSRLLAFSEDPKKAASRRFFQEFLETVQPPDRPGDFNQAMMELGATICLPQGSPHCEKCPLLSLCRAYEKGTPLDYPVKVPLKPPVEIWMEVYLLTWGDFLALDQGKKKLLQGLYAFPHEEGPLEQEVIRSRFPAARSIEERPCRQHLFSHQHWTLRPWRISLSESLESYRWVPRETLDEYPMSRAFSRCKNEVL